MKRIVIAGGTGFIGSALVRALVERGDRVSVLTRDASRRHSFSDAVELVEWHPTQDGDWQRALDGQDAVVQLAGEVLVGRRYTERLKQEFHRSRVASTECLVRGIERAARRPSVFLCGSAIGYYGADTGRTPLDENAPAGSDFAARLCVDWEQAARRAEALGVRVVSARLGIVLGEHGGALAKMALPFKLFAGGPIGSGEQMVSWIHMTDAVAILERCLDDAALGGPVNVTAPEPATNRELSRAIAGALHRPSYLRVPGFALKMLFGEGAQPILGGQNVLPKVMLEHGFEFRFTDVARAVEDVLKG